MRVGEYPRLSSTGYGSDVDPGMFVLKLGEVVFSENSL